MKINKLINGYYIWGNGTVTLQRINNRKTRNKGLIQRIKQL